MFTQSLFEQATLKSGALLPGSGDIGASVSLPSTLWGAGDILFLTLHCCCVDLSLHVCADSEFWPTVNKNKKQETFTHKKNIIIIILKLTQILALKIVFFKLNDPLMFCCLYSGHGEIDVHSRVLIRAYGNDRRFATASSNKKVTCVIFWVIGFFFF